MSHVKGTIILVGKTPQVTGRLSTDDLNIFMFSCLFFLSFGHIYSSENIFNIEKIQFIGVNAFSEEDLEELIYTEEDEEFDARLVKLDKIVLINFYRKNGFLTAEIKDSLIQKNILQKDRLYN